MKSITSETVSEVNVVAVVAEEGIAGEEVEEMKGTGTILAEGLIVEDLDTQDRHGVVILEIEGHSAHLQENQILMFPVAVMDGDETTDGDLLLPSWLLL